MYAIYEVLYKRAVVDAEERHTVPSTLLFLGLTGVITLLLFWPGLLLLDVTGAEKFEMPDNGSVFHLLLIAVMDGLLWMFIFIGIMFSSPLFISVGTMMAIPTNVVINWILHSFQFSAMVLVGIACIVLGFIGLNVAQCLITKHDRRKSRESVLSFNGNLYGMG